MFGIKKPMNMLEAPIYPDIKKGPTIFKNSGKYWQVDTGQTLLDTESNTQLYGDAVLARSYRDNIDKYGQSSYQEKITVFRPPLQSNYEDFGPLNRIPTKIHAIRPNINSATVNDGGGTAAYTPGLSNHQNVNDYISKKVVTQQYRETYYLPIESKIDTTVLPDLTMTLPAHSAHAGQITNIHIDAPREYKMSEVQKPQAIFHAGSTHAFRTAIYDQTPIDLQLNDNNPSVSALAGYTPLYTTQIDTGLSNLELERGLPERSVMAGMQSSIRAYNENGLENLELERKLPVTNISAGYNTHISIDDKTQSLLDRELTYIPTKRLHIENIGSDDGYHTQVKFYDDPADQLKLKENPKVQAVARPTFSYQENSGSLNKKADFKTKIEPLKSYSTGLGRGTIPKYGIDVQNVNSRYISK